MPNDNEIPNHGEGAKEIDRFNSDAHAGGLETVSLSAKPCPKCGSKNTTELPKLSLADPYHCEDCGQDWTVGVIAGILGLMSL